MFPKDTQREDLIAASRLFDLAPQMPPVDWDKALWHLPTQDIMKNVDGPRGIFADKMPVETGGAMHAARRRTIRRVAQGRPVARRHGAQRARASGSCRGTTCRSGPNLEMFNHVRQTAKPAVRRSAVGDHRAGRALRLHARHREHHRRRAQHGRRAARLQRHHLRLLRQVPEGRRQRRGSRSCRRSPTTRWAATSGRRPTRGRRPARSR